MESKHKECFTPAIIKHWGLQPVSRYAREAAEFVNLYSVWRGINRWPALIKTFDLLRERPEVQARGVAGTGAASSAGVRRRPEPRSATTRWPAGLPRPATPSWSGRWPGARRSTPPSPIWCTASRLFPGRDEPGRDRCRRPMPSSSRRRRPRPWCASGRSTASTHMCGPSRARSWAPRPSIWRCVRRPKYATTAG